MTCPEKWYDWLLATLHAIVAKDSDTIPQVLTNFWPLVLANCASAFHWFCYGDSQLQTR